jgi:hypothetical protein
MKRGCAEVEEETILFTTKDAKFTKVRVKLFAPFVFFVIFVVSF